LSQSQTRFDFGRDFWRGHAGLFLLVNVATKGQWWVNIIQANVNAYDWNQAWFLYRPMVPPALGHHSAGGCLCHP